MLMTRTRATISSLTFMMKSSDLDFIIHIEQDMQFGWSKISAGNDKIGYGIINVQNIVYV